MASAKWVSHTFLAMLSLYTVGEHNETIMFSFQISDLKKRKILLQKFGRKACENAAVVPGERMGWLMKLIGRNKCNFLPFIFGPFQEGDNSATRLREIYFLLSVSGLFCRVSEPLPHGAGVFGSWNRSRHFGPAPASIFKILNFHAKCT